MRPGLCCRVRPAAVEADTLTRPQRPAAGQHRDHHAGRAGAGPATPSPECIGIRASAVHSAVDASVVRVGAVFIQDG